MIQIITENGANDIALDADHCPPIILFLSPYCKPELYLYLK